MGVLKKLFSKIFAYKPEDEFDDFLFYDEMDEDD